MHDMMALLKVFTVILLMFKFSSQHYQLSITARDANSNRLTLHCTESSGNHVSGVLFYRNGLQNTSDLTCFKDASATNAINELRFNITPDCDGYFSCGKADNSGNIGLSEPISIYAYPIKTSSDKTISGIEGGDITLHCDFVKSPINRYTTTWYRGVGSMAEEIMTTTNSHIQDLVMRNLNMTDSLYPYNCFIQTDNPPSVTSRGPTINLMIKEKYEYPNITNELSYTKRGNVYEFTIEASGTQPLQYEWLLNGTAINSNNHGNMEVVEVNDRRLVVNVSACGQLVITYKVSNTDYYGVNHLVIQKAITDVHIAADPLMISRDLSHANDGNIHTFTVDAVGTNVHYSWYINGTEVNSLSYVNVKEINMKRLVLEITTSGPLKVTYKLSSINCYGLSQLVEQTSHFTVNEVVPFHETTIGKVIIPLAIVTLLSLALNLILCNTAIIVCYKRREQRKQQEQTDERPSSPPTLQNQISTMSHESREIRILRIIRQISSNGQVSYCDKTGAVIQISRSTSGASSISSSTNPVANILMEIAKGMNDIEYTDTDILMALNVIIIRLLNFPKDEKQVELLVAISTQLLGSIQEIRKTVPNSRIRCQNMHDDEPVDIDNSNEVHHPKRVATDDHIISTSCMTPRCDEGDDRPLTADEKEEFIQLLDNMSTQLNQFIQINNAA
jgi:hypothetical protein